MKKLALIVCVVFISAWSNESIAQSNFDKGTGVLQFTIGFPQLLGSGALYKTRIPAMAVAYDHCIVDGLIDGNASIGIGGLIGVAGSKYTGAAFFGNPGYVYNNTYVLFGGRGTFHYQWIDGLDTYAGILLGGYTNSATYEGAANPAGAPTPDGGGVLYGAFAGAKYYFSDNFSVLGEVGYGIAVLNVGVGFRF